MTAIQPFRTVFAQIVSSPTKLELGPVSERRFTKLEVRAEAQGSQTLKCTTREFLVS